MGLIVNGDKQIECPDGEMIQAYCEEIDIPFGCRDGMCGTCQIDVLEGMENLSPMSESEIDMDLEDGIRLACQCVMKQGKLVVRPSEY